MVRGVHLLAHCYLTSRTKKKTSGNSIVQLTATNHLSGWCAAKPACTASRSRASWRVPITATSALRWTKSGDHLVVIAALDNLGKGAAGSAVQCMNLMQHFDECAGLRFPGIYP